MLSRLDGPKRKRPVRGGGPAVVRRSVMDGGAYQVLKVGVAEPAGADLEAVAAVDLGGQGDRW